MVMAIVNLRRDLRETFRHLDMWMIFQMEAQGRQFGE